MTPPLPREAQSPQNLNAERRFLPVALLTSAPAARVKGGGACGLRRGVLHAVHGPPVLLALCFSGGLPPPARMLSEKVEAPAPASPSRLAGQYRRSRVGGRRALLGVRVEAFDFGV